MKTTSRTKKNVLQEWWWATWMYEQFGTLNNFQNFVSRLFQAQIGFPDGTWALTTFISPNEKVPLASNIAELTFFARNGVVVAPDWSWSESNYFFVLKNIFSSKTSQNRNIEIDHNSNYKLKKWAKTISKFLSKLEIKFPIIIVQFSQSPF